MNLFFFFVMCIVVWPNTVKKTEGTARGGRVEDTEFLLEMTRMDRIRNH